MNYPTAISPMILFKKTQKNYHASAGFSLVELMVAMAVGLIISAGAAALFANTILSTRTLTNATQIQEAGTQTSQLLARHLRMAGYVDWLSSTAIFNELNNSDNAAAYNLGEGQTVSMFQRAFAAQEAQVPSSVVMPIQGCEGAYTNPNTLSDTACSDVNAQAQSLTVAYQVASKPDTDSAPSIKDLGVFRNTDGMSGDCNNQSTTTLFAVSRIYLNNKNELVCKGNGKDGNSAAQPFASNIEQFVVLYGTNGTPVTTFNSNDSQVSKYQTASQVSANNAWGQVISVRVCFVVMGETGSAATASAGTTANRLDCLGAPLKLLPDRRLRQTFTNTIALRNNIHTSTAR
jgi:prepilin-type N-terminal cleavage/methylation domain-containing protein